MKYITGVGSRMTPEDALEKIGRIAQYFARQGYVLRSGGANGADLAFENAYRAAKGSTEIYLPWEGFNGSSSELYGVCPEALKLASTIHPAWHACSDAAKRLHARNCYQVLGRSLDRPSDLLVCWTPPGSTGGTRTAIVLAERHGVPVFNLGVEGDIERLRLSWYNERLQID